MQNLTIDNLYSSIISARTFKASSIKVAEYQKLSRCQRDLISHLLMN